MLMRFPFAFFNICIYVNIIKENKDSTLLLKRLHLHLALLLLMLLICCVALSEEAHTQLSPAHHSSSLLQR